MKHYVVIAATAAALFAGAAGANDKQSKAAWQSLDQDRDGVVTRAEAQGSAQLTDKFDSYDANRDGVLSKKEFEASHTAQKPSSSTNPSLSAPAGTDSAAPQRQDTAAEPAKPGTPPE